MSQPFLSLKQRWVVPPGGWVFTVKETQSKITAGSRGDLVLKVKDHYTANGIEVPWDLAAVIEDQICRRVGPDHCEWSGVNFEGVNANLSMSDAVNGTRVLMSWVLAGTPRVSQNEANTRAATCAGCPLNTLAAGCPGCGGLRAMVADIVGGQVTHEGKLGACAVCKCSNRAAVWLPLDIVRKGLTSSQNELLPDYCWKKVIS